MEEKLLEVKQISCQLSLLLRLMQAAREGLNFPSKSPF